MKASTAAALALLVLGSTGWAPSPPLQAGLASPGNPVTLPANATYEIDFADPVHQMSVQVAIAPEPFACDDGFGRTWSCIVINVTWSMPGVGIPDFPRVAEFSLDHVEAVTFGQWDMDTPGFNSQSFATPSPKWLGHPLPFPITKLPHREGLRTVLVGALAAPLRAEAWGPGTYAFGGLPGQLAVTTDGAAATVTATFVDPRDDSRAYEYAAIIGSDGPLPTSIEYRQIAPEERLIADVHRTSVSDESLAVTLTGTAPMTFPAARDGVTLMPWDRVPPDRGDDLFYPLSSAWVMAGSSPVAEVYHLLNPDAYLVDAGYSEFSAHATGDLGIDWGEFRFGTWILKEADPQIDNRSAVMRASAPAVVDQVHVGELDEDVDKDWQPLRTWIPPRSDLPDDIVTVEDALRIGRQYIPFDPVSYAINWDVAQHPTPLETPHAATYTVRCGARLESGFLSARVSAINGQILWRNALGTTDCVIPSSDDPVTGPLDPLVPTPPNPWTATPTSVIEWVHNTTAPEAPP